MASSNIAEALSTYLLATTAVSDVIGTRLDWLNAAQESSFPYVVFEDISDPHERLYLGGGNAGQVRMQFTGYTNIKTSTLAGIEAIKDALEFVTTTSMDGVQIIGIWPSDLRSRYENETQIYEFSCDFRIEYLEP